MEIGNGRGITLLSLTRKICRIMLLKRIASAVDNIICQQQAGFRKGRTKYMYLRLIMKLLVGSKERQSYVVSSLIGT